MDIRTLLARRLDCRLIHALRQGNRCAYYLAKIDGSSKSGGRGYLELSSASFVAARRPAA